MNGTHHQGSVRCSCWHSTNPRIILSGGDDRTIRLWRLYPHNSLYQSTKPNNKAHSRSNTHSPIPHKKTHVTSSGSDDLSSNSEIELQYDEQLSDDDDPNRFITDFDPSIQPMSHLLSMPASGEVKGLAMSPYNGEIIVATSSRLFNQKSSLDILNIPHWTWNYSSKQRLPYKVQLRDKYITQTKTEKQRKNTGINLAINSLDDELQKENNPFIENATIESADFVNRPSVIPLPYGARERCISFAPSPNIVFVGLLSCRKKHQRRYCCLMACNIMNGASRPCKKINALLHRKECIYSIELISISQTDNAEEKRGNDSDTNTKYRLALGTNLGRLIIVTLKQDLSWINTRKSFINEYTIALEQHPSIESMNANGNANMNGVRNGYTHNNGVSNASVKQKSKKSGKHHRKTSSQKVKYSVLTSRERCFREMSDPITVTITYESMKKYLWNKSSQIDERDIKEFFQFMKPNRKNQITFTQFVQRVDEDGNFMRAFEQFCLTGSSRTDRRAWMDGNDGSDSDESDEKGNESDDSDWELAMLNHRGGDKLSDENAITAIAWNDTNDSWIITGHSDGDIKFWNKEFFSNDYYANVVRNNKSEKYLRQSGFYYVLRGSMKRHSDSITCLTLSGTYLVSSSSDGNILIWHLDFLLPSVSLPMNITLQSRGIIQLLATINSAHLGDEICDVRLSQLCGNISYCVPNALYLLSCGADENIRCRDVMEILRQQLTLRILAESHQENIVERPQIDEDDILPRYDTYTAMNRTKSILHSNMDGNGLIDDSDGSDFGATEYQ